VNYSGCIRWEDHDLIFPTGVGTPMEPRSLNRLWSSLRAQAGMEDVKLHDLRHTMVTLLLDLETAPHIVQAIARHADVEVTMKVYAHANLDKIAVTVAVRRPPGTGPEGRLPWSGWRDLNPRPLAPKASALPNCATPRRQHAV
jgi:integrase